MNAETPDQSFTPAEKPPRKDSLLNLLWPLWLGGAFLAGGLLGYFFFARPLANELRAVKAELSALQAAAAAVPTPIPQQDKVIRYEIAVDDEPGYGPVDAPIVIVEFSDYECPFCRKWHVETWSQIEAKYSGQVRLVYRDFPLYGMHANAADAALAANCAGDQGKYWEFHNQLFIVDNPYSRSVYETIAGALALDMDAFHTCFDTGKYTDEIKEDYRFASELGVTSTPTFFINGLAVVGAQPFEVFDQLISMELAGQIPRE